MFVAGSRSGFFQMPMAASCPGVELLNKFKEHPDTVQEQSEADRNSNYVVARMMQWIPAQVQGLLAARRSALGAW